MGALTLKGFKLVDNGMAGLVIWTIGFSPQKTAIVEDCLIVGLSFGNANWYARPELVVERKRVGLIIPNSESLYVKNIRFYNYHNFGPEDTFVALESCARC